ncbi:MFS transporter [Promicromonospora sp. MS192]|uniref:MFS transporter n=1 Tax=Promicromonospora sp. MS192 TaxID=3412684 RepID=UPI003C30A8DD
MRHPHLVTLTATTFVTWTGQRITAVALPLVALDQTGDAWTTGLVGGFAGLPLLTSAWWGRRLRPHLTSGRALAVLLVVQALGLALVPVAAATVGVGAVVLCASGLVTGAASALLAPAQRALTADLAELPGIPPGVGPKALAWQDLAHRVSMIFAPALGAWLLVVWGTEPLLWCEAAAVALAAAVMLTVPAARTAGAVQDDVVLDDVVFDDVVLDDGGWDDGGQADAGRADAGRADVGRADVGRADAGRADAGRADVGRADAGRADVAPVDVAPAGEAAGTEGGAGVGDGRAAGSDDGSSVRALLRAHPDLAVGLGLAGVGGVTWFGFTLGLALLGAELGRPGELIAAGMAGYGAATVGASFVAPLVVDRVPRIPAIVISWVVFGLAYLALPVAAPDLVAVGLVSAVGGITMPFGIAALNALIVDRTTGAERRTAFTAETVLHAGGASAGLLAGGALIGAFGAGPVLVVTGLMQVVAALGAVVWLRIRRDTADPDRDRPASPVRQPG